MFKSIRNSVRSKENTPSFANAPFINAYKEISRRSYLCSNCKKSSLEIVLQKRSSCLDNKVLVLFDAFSLPPPSSTLEATLKFDYEFVIQ